MNREAKDPLAKKLHALALKIVEDASRDDVPLDRRLEALKIAGTYHVANLRVFKKGDDREEETDSFRKFRATISNLDAKEGLPQ